LAACCHLRKHSRNNSLHSNTQVIPYPLGNALGSIIASGTVVDASNAQGLPNPNFQSALLGASSQQCAFIEDSFEDAFQFPVLNLSRWMPVSATVLDHCPKPGAVGAANAATCTALMASQLQLNVPLPNYPSGDNGAIITLSQKPCVGSTACCVGSSCANWASAHLSSLGCIHYGVLETEAAFNIPPTSGGIAFFGTYIYGPTNSPGFDPSWNEIDQTFVNGASGGMEFHGSLFLSNPGNPSNAQEDKDVFDNTGVNCNSFVPQKGQPGNIRGQNAAYACPLYSTQMAAQYHTYKLIWTPAWLAWTVDNIVYRNSSAAPWRPVTMRPLLRTNIGTAASVASLPDANVYIRRIRYTRMDAAGMRGDYANSYVLQTAFNCASSVACHGSAFSAASGALQLSQSAASIAAAGRRRLAQSNAPVLSTNGTLLSPTVGPMPVSAYLSELASVTNATQGIVASVLPGVLANQVVVTITSHTISGTVLVTGITFASWTSAVQAAFINGLAMDVVPTPDQIFVSNAADASLLASWQAIPITPSGTLPSGILVSYTVDGYACPATYNASNPCLDAGYSLASGDVHVLNSVGSSSNVYAAVAQALSPSSGLSMTDVSPCIPSVAQLSCMGSDGMPLIAATVGVGINVFTPPSTTSASTTVSAAASAGSSSADMLEALFDSALNSGIISTALENAGIGTAAAPSNVQTARATRAAANGGTCPVPPTGPVVLPGPTTIAVSTVTTTSTTTDPTTGATTTVVVVNTTNVTTTSPGAGYYSSVSNADSTKQRTYMAVAIAFVVAFGVGLVGFGAGIAVVNARLSKHLQAQQPPAKIATNDM